MSDQTSSEETALSAAPDETEILADSVTDFVPLAWSREFLADDTLVPYREQRRFWRWAGNVAVLIAAVGITWLCVDHYARRPVIVTPPPVVAPPVTTTVAPPPPVATSQPPSVVTTTVLPPPVDTPVATVNDQTIAEFHALLAKDGLHIDHGAEKMKKFANNLCEDAAYGHLHEPTFYLSPTPGDEQPPNASEHAIHDALQAFCPRYAGLI